MKQRMENPVQTTTIHLVAVPVILAIWGCGCQHVLVSTPAFSPDSGVRRIDPNNGPFTIIESGPADPNSSQTQPIPAITWREIRITTDPESGQTYQIKACPVRFALGNNVNVPVTMPGGRKYWAMVDTGFSNYFYVDDTVVRECDLAVLPLGENPATGHAQGLCEIPSLKLGRTVIETLPCFYEHRHWQLRILGVPVYSPRTILLGLRFMRAHAYVFFDNARHTVLFSPREAFEPKDASAWVRLPFVFKEINDNLRMLVDLPVGEHMVPVEFDTGGAKPGLSLKEETWQRVAHQFHARDAGRGHYRNLQFGRLPCHTYTVPTLSIGPMDVRNARIDVVPRDDPVMRDFEGILSLNYFRKTSVVLDFRKRLIWIRKF